MGEETTAVSKVPGSERVDSFFTKLLGKVGQTVSAFVAFIFMIITLGIFIGYIVTLRSPDQIYISLIIPLILALIAYYNRAIATFLFFIILTFILLF